MGHRLVEFTTQPVRRPPQRCWMPSRAVSSEKQLSWRNDSVESDRYHRRTEEDKHSLQTSKDTRKLLARHPLPTGPIRILFRANKVRRGIVLEVIIQHSALLGAE
ncbi:hypothetical protein HNY73_001294 [Argiope bruennichi]|uniref:Uncharacterized protein n=1 Tax=Argiope bruennichi TaxID=94029 RepID=A0A8T0G399_ARGBR|nr:hypothetical protein HNY73_001294 [Argiope bruennichi]